MEWKKILDSLGSGVRERCVVFTKPKMINLSFRHTCRKTQYMYGAAEPWQIQNGGREKHTLVIWMSSDDKDCFVIKFIFLDSLES